MPIRSRGNPKVKPRKRTRRRYPVSQAKIDRAINPLKAFINQCGLPAFVLEHRFYGKIRWRFDFAWPDVKLAIEYQGGIFQGGHHTTLRGMVNDMMKLNVAQCLGWIVLQVNVTDLKTEARRYWLKKRIREAYSLQVERMEEWASRKR